VLVPDTKYVMAPDGVYLAYQVVGDGPVDVALGFHFFATFDGPARAIRCAMEIVGAVREIGLAVRAGVHIGECEIIDGGVSGLAVTIGARISAHAGDSQVLISQTVKELVAGSGFTYEDAGERDLKGVPGTWRLWAVSSPAQGHSPLGQAPGSG
jgi:class 3 adenylate cyclase